MIFDRLLQHIDRTDPKPFRYEDPHDAVDVRVTVNGHPSRLFHDLRKASVGCERFFRRVGAVRFDHDPAQMRSEAKRIQNEIQKIKAEYSNGGITVIAKGDMTIDKIAITPEAYDEVKAGKPQRFETMLFNVVNGALKKAKDATQAEMQKMMQACGAGGLFGK